MISFEFKPEKFATVVAYIAERKHGVTKKELCKLIFYADKEHLIRYGRPITGDRYYALEQGPVPSQGLDALNAKGRPECVEAVRRYGQLQGWVFLLQAPPDLKALSKSDIKILDEILDRLGALSAWELEGRSHQEPAWRNATPNATMDFLEFFEGHPEAEGIRSILVEGEEVVTEPAAAAWQMRLDPGTIAHWRDFKPGLDKFIYIIGLHPQQEVLSFTISSQTKYLGLSPHKDEMIEIPFAQTPFLNRRSFIQCFKEVTRTPLSEFRRLESDGSINWRACMPQFLQPMVAIIENSELLTGYDQELVLDLIRKSSA